MRRPSRGRLRQRAGLLRQRFLQEGALPFAEVLSAGRLDEVSPIPVFEATIIANPHGKQVEAVCQ